MYKFLKDVVFTDCVCLVFHKIFNFEEQVILENKTVKILKFVDL